MKLQAIQDDWVACIQWSFTMGLMRHHAIIVTGWDEHTVNHAHELAVNQFGTLVTPIVRSKTNGYYTFFVGPDGSKEGWAVSNDYNIFRGAFMNSLKDLSLNASEVQYYCETGVTWVRSKDQETVPDDLI